MFRTLWRVWISPGQPTQIYVETLEVTFGLTGCKVRGVGAHRTHSSQGQHRTDMTSLSVPE